MTVVFPTPPAAVTEKWKLANADGISHFICMPGRSYWQVEAFVADVLVALRKAAIPRQRLNAVPMQHPSLPATAG
jgi:histidine decarboxylase